MNREEAVALVYEFVKREESAIRDYMHKNPEHWWRPFEYFWGRTIKAHLVENNAPELADEWVALVEEAMRQ